MLGRLLHYHSLMRPIRWLVLLSLLIPAGPGFAQMWAGSGMASGTVSGSEGEPLEGATVELGRVEDGEGPPAVSTSSSGAWRIRGLAPGSWAIRVSAEGHKAGEGTIVVTGGFDPPIEMQLRSLEEVSPILTEGNPETIRKWLELGDSLLEQGEPARAREEYEKALAALPPEERAPVLLLVARCRYLEGDRDAAVEVMETALRLAPRDEATRRIYRMVQEERGVAEKADAFLAALPDEPDLSAVQAVEPEPSVGSSSPEIAAQLALPLTEPTPGRRGTYRVSFGSSSPASDLDELVTRVGFDPALVERGEDSYAPAEETWQVHVPEAYTEGEGWGLFVWVSPTPFGGTVWEEMRRLLGDRKLIWIGANDAGNSRPAWDRYRLALDAAHHMKAVYDLDPRRIYVGGYSGGGRIAGGLSVLYPEVFHGGLWYMGCGWYDALPLPDRPGHRWRPGFAEPPRDTLETVRARNRYVLVTGSRDFNRSECREVAEAMEAAGFDHVTFLDVPGADHYHRAPIEWWGRALGALESP